MPALILPWLDTLARGLTQPQDGGAVDFSRPVGEPALVPADSVSWRIFKNPVALFVGGVTAVLLEFGDPAVRTGVWEHSSFRHDPVHRLRRTGMAAMVTVYGAKSVAGPMIEHVVRLHEKVKGIMPEGQTYAANDVALLTWVHATAGYGFAEAYAAYVHPLGDKERDRLCREGKTSAELYGARLAPASWAEMMQLFESKRSRLEGSPIVFEFLEIMRHAPIFPMPLRPLQRLLLRAAVEIVPGWIRERLGLTAEEGLRGWERPMVRLVGRMADRVLLRSSPAVQACVRLGLPADWLYR